MTTSEEVRRDIEEGLREIKSGRDPFHIETKACKSKINNDSKANSKQLASFRIEPETLHKLEIITQQACRKRGLKYDPAAMLKEIIDQAYFNLPRKAWHPKVSLACHASPSSQIGGA